MEDEIVNKRRALATHRKEMTKVQFLESYHQATSPGPIKADHRSAPPTSHSFHLFEKENYHLSEDRRFQGFNADPPHVETNSYFVSSPSDLDQSRFDEELRSAKKVMAMAKDGLNRSSQRKIQSERFLQHENSFLSKIHRKDSERR
jgi:hypothetical protein